MKKQQNKIESSDSSELLIEKEISTAANIMKEALQHYNEFIEGKKNKIDLEFEEVSTKK